MTDIDIMLAAYIECALWSTTDASDPETGGDPLDDNYCRDDIHPDTLAKMREDCEKFLMDNAEDISMGPERATTLGSARVHCLDSAGHDFWLTRNGHGSGFWDGDWPEEEGERLTEASKAFGEFNLYVGDDGMIHN